jgi:DNA-binding response OmpR family regulator
LKGEYPAPIRVLIGESDRVLGDLYRTALESNGWEVEVVHDGRSVLSRVWTSPPDVLLVNTLPDIDAFAVVEQIRAHLATHALVIVVLLDSVSNLDVQRVKKLDVQAWLSKTRITREELSETIGRLVGTEEDQQRSG